MDILIVTFGIIILFLPIIIITVALFLTNDQNPFYCQQRPGKDGKNFTLIKFRTMNNKKDKDGNLLPDVTRLTQFGRFLRATSLDELPQLINVLRGDLSLVGPRPLLPEYLPFYNKQQARRHEVRPGITGLAQVKGRNSLSWDQKFILDVYYVDHISFQLDIKILILTVWKVFKQEGINSNNLETMKKFTGSKN